MLINIKNVLTINNNFKVNFITFKILIKYYIYNRYNYNV